MKRESFVFYESFLDAAEVLDEENQLIFIKAVAKYGIYGEMEDDLPAVVKAMMTLVIPQLEANNERYTNGKKGGRPKKNQWLSDKKTNGYEIEKPNDNVNVNDNVNDNVNVNANGNVNEQDSKIEKLREELRFSTIKVENACYSIGIDSKQFVDIADKVLCEWKAVETNDVSWRHLINAVRVHCQRNKSPVSQRMSNKAKLIEEVNKMNEITIKNGSVTKNSEQPSEPIW